MKSRQSERQVLSLMQAWIFPMTVKMPVLFFLNQKDSTEILKDLAPALLLTDRMMIVGISLSHTLWRVGAKTTLLTNSSYLLTSREYFRKQM